MGSSEAPISRTYLFRRIGNPLFGNLWQRIGNGLLFGVAAKEAGCQRTYPRPHPRTRVSLRADVRGHLVHSKSHLASLPLRRNLLLGLSILLRRITEKKGRYQAIQEHFSASLEKRCLRSSHTVMEGGN